MLLGSVGSCTTSGKINHKTPHIMRHQGSGRPGFLPDAAAIKSNEVFFCIWSIPQSSRPVLTSTEKKTQLFRDACETNRTIHPMV